MPNPTNDGAHLRPLANALRRFRRMLDGCTRPHPEGREVVHSVPLREAADDLANAAGAVHQAQWAQHATVQHDGPHSTGQMAIGRGRGADAVTMAAVWDAVNIVMYRPGELPGKRWPQGHVFDAETLGALDRALALVEPEVGEAGSGNPKPETFAFKDDHLTLLAELAGHDRLVKATELDGLSGMPPIDKMRKLLGELERAGFVRRPSGANSGYGITADGRAELSRRNMLPD